MGRVWLCISFLFALTFSACARHLPLQTPKTPAEVIAPEAWILIDSKSKQLFVMEGQTPVLTLDKIAFGSGGVGEKQKVGDTITPAGVYHVTSIRKSARYNTFVQIDYPSVEDAERGVDAKRITRKMYQAIVRAHSENILPPQNTRLGGLIGIHGIGDANPEVHRLLNWTDGCIALDNEQIRELTNHISVGTLIRIQ